MAKSRHRRRPASASHKRARHRKGSILNVHRAMNREAMRRGLVAGTAEWVRVGMGRILRWKDDD